MLCDFVYFLLDLSPFLFFGWIFFYHASLVQDSMWHKTLCMCCLPVHMKQAAQHAIVFEKTSE